ncbi:hypothetical protein ZEAMMB73_Zm00001d013821 [Zea mays]|uniref:Methyltransferase FkbM domain-containing protein n=1 Tax=Zea mays TaxID=4577 RepID=A0A1D6GME6_MAIZE|nr:hypothetical protein ZEAMMB73_Zm00001d013821 [Zea mays]AQK64463.1 hypothetical protein ZEAMMB73_Zm00001d013821 [Zea mays]
MSALPAPPPAPPARSCGGILDSQNRLAPLCALESAGSILRHLCGLLLLRRLPGDLRSFGCYASPQASSMVANLVEGVSYPFFYSLADMGDWSTGQQCYICRRCKVSIKSNAEIAVEVSTIPLDELVPDTERVLLIKVDVQGWEYHVLGGASNLLSRRKGEAPYPYLIYEEDEHLLQAGNSSAQDIRTFLTSVGYNHCKRHGNGAHGKRNRQICF